jgi:hypothetical protein
MSIGEQKEKHWPPVEESGQGLVTSVAMDFYRKLEAEAVGELITELQKMLKGLRRKLITNH